MKKRSMRSVIKSYRASGKMFAQTFHTGTNWGIGYRPEPMECNKCGDEQQCIVEWYTDPCHKGITFDKLLQEGKS